MKYLIYLLLIFSSCSYHKTSILTKKDLLEQILQVTKDKTKNELYRQFGSPINISNLPDNADIDVLEYKSPLLHAYLNKSSKKIELIVLFNSNKDLNYEYMKKNFLS